MNCSMNRILNVLHKNNIFLLISSLATLGMLGISKNIRIKLFIGILYLVLIAVCCINIKKKKVKADHKISMNYKAVILSLVLDGIILFDFHQNLKSCIPRVLYKIPLISPEISLIIVGLIGCSVGLFSLYILSINMLNLIKPIYRIILKYNKQFIALLAIHFLGIITLLRENIYYADDMLRVNVYYSMSGDFSRYVSEFLSNIFHGSIALTDVSPLPQIIAIIFLALTGIVVVALY